MINHLFLARLIRLDYRAPPVFSQEDRSAGSRSEMVRT